MGTTESIVSHADEQVDWGPYLQLVSEAGAVG